MEADPFQLIEGMTIAGLGVGATRGYIYLRSEYPKAQQALEAAIDIAEQAGYLGKNICGSDAAFKLECAWVPAPIYVVKRRRFLIVSRESGVS